MVIVVYCSSFIFPIFFNAVSAIKHLENRLKVNYILSDEIWEIKNYLATNIVVEEYTNEKKKNCGFEVRIAERVKKIPGSMKLYGITLDAFWGEGRKENCLSHTQYLLGR